MNGFGILCTKNTKNTKNTKFFGGHVSERFFRFGIFGTQKTGGI